MTNREYMHTLNSEELALWVAEEPWHFYTNGRYLDDKISYIDALVEWLDKEHNSNGQF